MILSKENTVVKQLNEKCTRSILVYSDAIMLVEFRFKKGGVGEAHQHADHEQVGYIAKGSFELTVGSEKRIVRAGDSYYAARNVMHGVVALEDDSVIIDTFTPKRDDFLL